MSCQENASNTSRPSQSDLYIPPGVAIAAVPPLTPGVGLPTLTASDRSSRNGRATRRLLPRTGEPRSALQTMNALRLIAHYGITSVSPPGQHCACAVLSGRHTCKKAVLVEGHRLPCHALSTPLHLDHTRIATTLAGGTLLISSQYDGLFCDGRYVNGIAAVMGLIVEVSEVSAWLPGRTLTVIIRRNPAGSVLGVLADPSQVVSKIARAAATVEASRQELLNTLRHARTRHTSPAELEELDRWADRVTAANAEVQAMRTEALAALQALEKAISRA
jgi:hypothetical protein